MPRILAMETPKKALLRGQDHMWSVMLELDKAGPFTTGDVDRQTNVRGGQQVARYMNALRKSGHLEAVGQEALPVGKVTVWRVARREPVAPSIKADGSPSLYGRRIQSMWNVLRGPQARNGIRAEELALLASIEECVVAVGTAKEYLHALNKAGCLQELHPAKMGKGGSTATYRLTNAAKTGPQAPMLMASRLIFDPNLGKVLGRELEAVEIEP